MNVGRQGACGFDWRGVGEFAGVHTYTWSRSYWVYGNQVFGCLGIHEKRRGGRVSSTGILFRFKFLPRLSNFILRQIPYPVWFVAFYLSSFTQARQKAINENQFNQGTDLEPKPTTRILRKWA